MRLVHFKQRYPISDSGDVWINADMVTAVVDGSETNEAGERIECALIHATGFYADVHGSAAEVVAKLGGGRARQ